MHVIYSTNGYKHVQMGCDGCVWVRWGVGGMSITKSRQAGDICGVAGLYLWSMAGEISPDIMFYVFCRKWSKMNVYGYFCICMGALSPMVTGGRRNKTKRAQNGKVWHVLWSILVAKNDRKVTGPIIVIRDDHLKDLGGKKLFAAHSEC